MSTFKHYGKESGNILCAGERNNSTAGQEWSQRGDGKDIWDLSYIMGSVSSSDRYLLPYSF